MKFKFKYLVYTLIVLLIPVSVFAEEYSYRGKEMNVVYIIGVALLAIRIVIPILLIVMGMIGLVQAMTQNSDTSMSKELKKMVPKVIIAIAIFILPTLLALIMKLINKSSLWAEYSSCISRPSTCSTKLWEEPPVVDYSSRDSVIIQQDWEPGLSDAEEMVAYAMQFKGKDVETDCSGFVKKVLKKFNHLDDEMKSTSGYCKERSRGSYGMYLLYKKRGQIVWERSSSAKTVADALSEFPGGCKKGDLIFYTYGAGSGINDCVQHVVLYTGYENGKPMILDSNTQDHIVKYRGVGDVWWAAVPLACARPE